MKMMLTQTVDYGTINSLEQKIYAIMANCLLQSWFCKIMSVTFSKFKTKIFAEFEKIPKILLYLLQQCKSVLIHYFAYSNVLSHIPIKKSSTSLLQF